MSNRSRAKGPIPLRRSDALAVIAPPTPATAERLAAPALQVSDHIAIEAAHKRFMKALRHAAYYHGQREVFRDFVASARIALEQAANRAFGRFDDALEAEYGRIAKKYGERFLSFPEMLAAVVEGLCEPHDFLGKAYMDLEVRDRDRGQFFTPWHVALMMAQIQIPDWPEDVIALKGAPLTACEPACGSGVLILAFAHVLRSKGLDPARTMLATCIDVDRLCADMAYVQTTLMGIPADIHQGNSLSMEMSWSRANLHAMTLRATHPSFRAERAAAAGQVPPPALSVQALSAPRAAKKASAPLRAKRSQLAKGTKTVKKRAARGRARRVSS